MATEIKDRTMEAIENTVVGADLVTGAAVTIADNLSRVVNHPGREAHKIERRGAVANRRLGREVADFVEDASEKVEAMMPERVALLGIRAIKARARRKDAIGGIAYRTLELVNGGLQAILGTLNRLQRATEPPARTGGSHLRPARPVGKAVRTVRRTASARVRSARSSVRRGAAGARRSERASA
jgi:hypothetical protein